jgi:hypothetical protein
MPVLTTFNSLSINGYENAYNDPLNAILQSEITNGTVIPLGFGDRFGISVDITSDGNTIVVGAPGDDSGKGSAYVYTRTGTTWSLEAKLIAPIRVNDSSFGLSVAIHKYGNYGISIAVGAPTEPKGTLLDYGAVYKYIKLNSGGTWELSQRYVPLDGNAGGNYGQSVTLNIGGTLAVAAPGSINGGKLLKGRVYVYYPGRPPGSEFKIIGTGVDTYQFGSAIKFSGSGNTLVVGSYQGSRIDIYEVSVNDSYVLKKSISSGGNGMNPNGTFNNAWFGYSVSVSFNGDTIVVGEPLKEFIIKVYNTPNLNTGVYNDQGSIRIMKRTVSSWGLVQGVNGDQIAQGYNIQSFTMENFGWSVDINSAGTEILVGARRSKNSFIANQGDAHKLILTTTSSSFIISQQYNLVSDDGQSGDLFGSAVAISDDHTMVIGAPRSGTTKPGTIYIYVDP